jgi:hypothetical protein
MIKKDQFLVPFDAARIRQRVGSGNKQFDYVPGGDITGRLIQVTDNEYDWEVTRLEIVEHGGKPHWLCHGLLTVPGLGRRSGVGSHQVMDMECPKAAETDAFKRACVKFGIGLQLYCEVDEYGVVERMATEEQRLRVLRLREKLGLPPLSVPNLTYDSYLGLMTELKAVEQAMEARQQATPEDADAMNRAIEAAVAEEPAEEVTEKPKSNGRHKREKAEVVSEPT